jgi:peptide/nickel transport system permease protein
MFGLISRRLAMSVALVFVASALTFVLISITPGDPVSTLLGGDQQARAEDVARLRQQLGLNEPLVQRYWDWLSGAIHGDFGKSIVTGQPVTEALNSRLSVTLNIIVAALLLSTIVGVALGVVSALRRGWLGRATDVVSLAGLAVPSFWLGLVLVAVFAVSLGWFPANGYSPFSDGPWDWLQSITLPVLALFVGGVAVIAKQTRNAMSEVLDSEFIRNLHANGLPRRSIIFRHALRNAAIPIVTVVGLGFIGLLGGTVFIEQLFVLPGLGSLAVNGVQSHDIPIVQGVVVYFVVIVAIVNLAIDLVYGWLNPKARLR